MSSPIELQSKPNDPLVENAPPDATPVDTRDPPEAAQVCCHGRCAGCCDCILAELHPLPPNPTTFDRLKYSFFCPPHGIVELTLLLVVMIGCLWGLLWGLWGDDALPGGNSFSLIVMMVLCVIGGKIMGLCRMPELLGMLIVGVLCRNIPGFNIIGLSIDHEASAVIRGFALSVILIRAGLGLDPAAMRRLSCAVIRLAFLPCLAEAASVAVAAYLIMNMPWVWGFMLGFVLAAVSPAVVTPILIDLQERGFGVDKGIPTLVIAAASIDDVIAISGFGVALAIAFSNASIVMSLLKGPLEAIIGIGVGIVAGIPLWWIPSKERKKSHRHRFLLLILVCFCAFFICRRLEFPGSGPLASLTLAYVVALGWRKDEICFDKVWNMFTWLWSLLEALLFGLIGNEVDISQMDTKAIGLAMLVLAAGLVFRLIVSYLCAFGTGLSHRERIFVAIAWLPKATVQAAIGSMALDEAKKRQMTDLYQDGMNVVTIAVLSILITAPLGAILISCSGSRLLSRGPPAHHAADEVEARARISSQIAPAPMNAQVTESPTLLKNFETRAHTSLSGPIDNRGIPTKSA